MKSCTMMSLVLGCSIVLLALAQVSAAGSLTLQVEPKTKECFYEEFKQVRLFSGYLLIRLFIRTLLYCCHCKYAYEYPHLLLVCDRVSTS